MIVLIVWVVFIEDDVEFVRRREKSLENSLLMIDLICEWAFGFQSILDGCRRVMYNHREQVDDI
jgi:hypothetical protein